PLSSGLNGSWFFSCVVIRLRNSSWPSDVRFGSGTVPSPSASYSLRLPTGVVIAVLLHLAERERAEQKLLRRVHDLEVVLIRARRGDHVGHLLERVYVRRVDHAVLVRLRMAGVVPLDRRPVALDHAEHAHAG